MKRLYELPPRPAEPIKIYTELAGEGVEQVIYYHNIDGMYSYCTVGDPNTGEVVHLSRNTPLEKFKDGYQIAEEPKEEE